MSDRAGTAGSLGLQLSDWYRPNDGAARSCRAVGGIGQADTAFWRGKSAGVALFVRQLCMGQDPDEHPFTNYICEDFCVFIVH